MAQLAYHYSPFTKSARPEHKQIPRTTKFPKSLNGKDKWKNEGRYVPQCTDISIHHRNAGDTIRRRMAELQPVARNGRMSQLGSHYPNGGDEPNTNSTLPIQMHPSDGKSSYAHLAITSAPLIHVDLSDVIMWRKSARTSRALETYQRL